VEKALKTMKGDKRINHIDSKKGVLESLKKACFFKISNSVNGISLA
jgi:hypothetical protein